VELAGVSGSNVQNQSGPKVKKGGMVSKGGFQENQPEGFWVILPSKETGGEGDGTSRGNSLAKGGQTI